MLPPFLEGFAAQRPLIHFVYVLELLRLLGQGDEPPPGVPLRLCRAVREAYTPRGTLRNAGAFFGVVCDAVPAAYLSRAEGLNLARWLATQPVYPYVEMTHNPETPPLELPAFWRLISERLQDFSEMDFRKWFRFGTGPLPDEGERIVREIVSTKPPVIQKTIDDLLRERPRMAGVLALVDTMVSALALPPRRRTPPELPQGGYADVTNRGEPERLLPSQFALDSDEFIRRFAEKELLFFRREEPHQRSREHLVLLVDQGVRTWGTVRLALSAAVLAFRKFAERRKLPFSVRFSADAGSRFDPSFCDATQFVDRLEASDLSPNPSDLVRAEFCEVDPKDADVVVLTHPRNLIDEGVKHATSSLPGTKRLFALAVDEDGAALFSQMRQGESLPISRFRVNIGVPEPMTAPPPKDDRQWTGDVEPVPFPFPLEPFRPIASIAFDADSRRLLVLTEGGMLHLWDLETKVLETLPRAFDGNSFSRADTVVGVRNGFVVGGPLDGTNLAVAHYDCNQRTVKLHKPAVIPGEPGTLRWYSIPETNTVALCQGAAHVSLDLTTGAVRAEPYDLPRITAFADRQLHRAPKENWHDRSSLLRGGPKVSVLPSQGLLLAPQLDAGRIRVFTESGPYADLTPVADGKPLLQGAEIAHSLFGGSTLAIFCTHHGPKPESKWHLLNIRDESTRAEFPGSPIYDSTARLSPDGRFFARHRGPMHVVVDTFPKAGGPVFAMGLESVPDEIGVELGYRDMNIAVGNNQHILSWWSGPLTHRFLSHRQAPNFRCVVGARGLPHPLVEYDPSRFVSLASKEFDVLVDIAGQVIVYDRQRKRVVCIFLARRGQFAAWMPDGTRYGPAHIIGQPSTPDALDHIGDALRQASSTEL